MMATPLNPQSPEGSPSAAEARSSPHSNTAKPTPPFAVTHSVPSTVEQCQATRTHPSTPPPHPTMSSTPLSERTPNLPPISSKSSTTNRPATSWSHPPTRQFSTFPTSPLHPSKKSHPHPYSKYTSAPTASDITL